jgi:hypothetical protein
MAEQDGYKTEVVGGLKGLLKFRRNPLAYLRYMSVRGVDIRQITIRKRRVFFVNHPTLIRDVLVTHIGTAFRICEMVRDNAAQQMLESMPRFAGPSGSPAADHLDGLYERAVQQAKLMEDIRHRVANLPCLSKHIGREQSAAHNLQNQTHHLLIDRNALFLTPSAARSRAQIHHGPRVARQPLAMEGRWSEPFLAAVQLSFAGQKTASKDRLRGASGPSSILGAGCISAFCVGK